MELNEVDVRILVSLERNGATGVTLTTLTRRLAAARVLKDDKERSLKKLESENLIQINITNIPGISGPKRSTIIITAHGKRVITQVKSGAIPIASRGDG